MKIKLNCVPHIISVNMKKPPNLNEEIAAMAKSDSTCASTQSIESARSRDEEKQCNSIIKPSSHEKQRKRKKCRSQLVQEIRISVSIFIKIIK